MTTPADAQALLDATGNPEWRACNDGTCSCRLVWGNHGGMVAKALCHTDSVCDGDGYLPEAAHANARMIAAAPALARTVVEMSAGYDASKRAAEYLNDPNNRDALDYRGPDVTPDNAIDTLVVLLTEERDHLGAFANRIGVVMKHPGELEIAHLPALADRVAWSEAEHTRLRLDLGAALSGAGFHAEKWTTMDSLILLVADLAASYKALKESK